MRESALSGARVVGVGPTRVMLTGSRPSTTDALCSMSIFVSEVGMRTKAQKRGEDADRGSAGKGPTWGMCARRGDREVPY